MKLIHTLHTLACILRVIMVYIYIPSSSAFLLCLVSLLVLVCDVARVTLVC